MTFSTSSREVGRTVFDSIDIGYLKLTKQLSAHLKLLVNHNYRPGLGLHEQRIPAGRKFRLWNCNSLIRLTLTLLSNYVYAALSLCATVVSMTDLMVREISPEVAAVIDGRAKRAKTSRQLYLHAFLTETFGPQKSVTAAIAERLRIVFDQRRKNPFQVPTIARGLGHESATELEANLSGEEPLSFATADKLCSLLGVYPQWLLNGELHPYYQDPLFHDSRECLNALASGEMKPRSGAPYSHWYFVLSDEAMGRAAVYGYSNSAPHRWDLILAEVPIGGHVGAGGTREIFQFALLCAATDVTLSRPPIVDRNLFKFGRILDKENFREFTEGRIHPELLKSAGTGHAAWAEDIWDLEYEGPEYTKNFAEAKDIFRLTAAEKGIANNKELEAYLRGLPGAEGKPLFN
jgi:hypothetical protein